MYEVMVEEGRPGVRRRLKAKQQGAGSGA
jgi:hypothetical protein